MKFELPPAPILDHEKNVFIRTGQVWRISSHQNPVVITDCMQNDPTKRVIFANKITDYPNNPQIAIYPGTEEVRYLQEQIGFLDQSQIFAGILRHNPSMTLEGIKELYGELCTTPYLIVPASYWK